MSGGWSPSYKDCDNIISDIYALTQTARMRRRPELGPDCRSSQISNIQSRPLPTPGAFSRQPDHIYQSPVRMGGGGGGGGPGPLYRPPQYPSRQQNFQKPSPGSSRYQQSSRIPLAVSQQSISQQKPLPSRTAGLRSQPGRETRRVSSHGGLGPRAVTELDFSRSRPLVSHCPVPSPSLTDSSEHSSSVLGNDATLRKGVMWVQQEKLFSRWKERFIILTSSYLHIFKKSTSRLSDMGTFVNKVSRAEFSSAN